MKVIFISDNGQRHKKISINFLLHIYLPILLLVASLALLILFGFISSFDISPSNKDRKVHEDFSRVLQKLAILDAEVERLNALSNHIASRSKLDIQAFDLSNIPARGGTVENNYYGTSRVRSNNIENSVSKIERNLTIQKLKLKNILASLEINEAQNYLDNIPQPTVIKPLKAKKSRNRTISYEFSTPLKKGYISSPFGDRRDPINGKFRHHGGLDIAAKKGTNVFAIANGFISFSGKKGAYGNLLEIDHSESLKSRYAHLDYLVVKKGQLVRKGDLIGKVGATGRVTGPHLHLEIRENNKIVDPKIYLNDALKTL